MKIKHYQIVIIILMLLSLSACVEPRDTQIPTTVAPEERILPSATPLISLTSSPANSRLDWQDLQCSKITEREIESQSDERSCKYPIYSIEVTDSADIFYYDTDNDVFLIYSGDSPEPNEIYIPKKYVVDSDVWFSLDDYQMYIRLKSGDFLILSIMGDFRSVFRVEAYEPYKPFGHITADGHGGFYSILLEASEPFKAYFKILHYIDEANVVVTDIDEYLYNSLPNSMLVGKDGVLYSYDSDGYIFNFGLSNNSQFEGVPQKIRIDRLSSQLDLEGYVFHKFLYVDSMGEFYTLFKEADWPKNKEADTVYIHFNDRGEILNAGLLPEKWKKIISSSSARVAPDGSLYALSFEDNDETCQMKIVKCTFPERE